MVFHSEISESGSGLAKATDQVVPRPRRWRAGLLFAATALFGGVAIAILNRSTLNSLRQADESGEEELPEAVVDRSRDVDGIY